MLKFPLNLKQDVVWKFLQKNNNPHQLNPHINYTLIRVSSSIMQLYIDTQGFKILLSLLKSTCLKTSGLFLCRVI